MCFFLKMILFIYSFVQSDELEIRKIKEENDVIQLLQYQLKDLESLEGKMIISPIQIENVKIDEFQTLYIVLQIGKQTFNTTPSTDTIWNDVSFTLYVYIMN